MRVIGGRAGGIRLTVPRDRATRPITDRVKETLFGILGDGVVAARVLDLYAGSGAIGIEALSRGAEHATFVERSRAAVEVLRENLRRTGLAAQASVETRSVDRFLASTSAERYDLAFLDPPYEERAILAPLAQLVPHLAPGASVVVKHFWRDAPPTIAGLSRWRERRFGETALTFFELVPRTDGVEAS